MRRRDFLKLVGATPLVGLTGIGIKEPVFISNGGCLPPHTWVDAIHDWENKPIGYCALEDIPKDGYGWVQVSGTAISGPPYSIEYGYHAGFDLSAERNVKRIANIDTSNLS